MTTSDYEYMINATLIEANNRMRQQDETNQKIRDILTKAFAKLDFHRPIHEEEHLVRMVVAENALNDIRDLI
jgi:hypothetical protein